MTQFANAMPAEAVRVMPDGRKVTAIPARVQAHAANSLQFVKKPRVAAYARVSTDQEEQETSFEAQCDYYGSLIRNNPEWEYGGLYTDDGISATSTARREGFNRLIADALAGKIDRIITKSVSRFARNTVDSLTTIRKLKEKGIGVTFEKENIDTLDSKGELMITIMSSLAQEESRSISENVTWGWRRRIADGKVSMAYGRFLGYDRGEDGTPRIVLGDTSRMADLTKRLSLLLFNSSCYISDAAGGNSLRDFTEGSALLCEGHWLGSLENTALPDMKEGAGVLPYPQLYASDKRYITATSNTANVGAVLLTAKDEAFISTVIQALNRETASRPIPKYYRDALKLRYDADPYTAGMIRILHDNIGGSFMLAYGNQAIDGSGNPVGTVSESVTGGIKRYNTN